PRYPVPVQPAVRRQRVRPTRVRGQGERHPPCPDRENQALQRPARGGAWVNVSDVDIPKYMEYVPIDLRFKIPSARLDTKLTLSFTQYKDAAPALIVAGAIALRTLSVTDLQERPIVSFPLLNVPVDALDVFAKKVNLGSILLQSPEVHLWRDKTGVLNVT